MLVFQMNKNDYVLHHSFEKAVNYHDQVTGVFEECKDVNTGNSYSIDDFKINVSEEGEEKRLMTVKEALEKGLTQVPDLYCHYY